MTEIQVEQRLSGKWPHRLTGGGVHQQCLGRLWEPQERVLLALHEDPECSRFQKVGSCAPVGGMSPHCRGALVAKQTGLLGEPSPAVPPSHGPAPHPTP